MKFFSTHQIRSLDQYSIEYEPISSIDLMERAAVGIYKKYLETFNHHQPILVFAGPGNNGGDALALARMLLQSGFVLKVVLLYTNKLSDDCEINRVRLIEKFPESLVEYQNTFIIPEVDKNTIVVDGLFGSGLTRPLAGIFAEAVKWINKSGCNVVSIDIPTGLQGEENPDMNVPIVKADYTFSLQFPKLAFILPDSAVFAGKWELIDIGIHPKAIAETESKFSYLEKRSIQHILKPRTKFSHKGNFGHLLLVAGSNGMAGAAVLSAKAALRTGAGLVTVHSAECNRIILQTAIPEVIFHSDKISEIITEFPELKNYNTLAIGPGIGMHEDTLKMLRNLLTEVNNPCILDADALNIISKHKDLLQLFPEKSIITPHPKEFERLFGKTNSSYERIIKASEMAQQFKIIIILKGAHTLIALPDGQMIFNSTGNAGMATAGSGDVLTGIIGSLLAQGYAPENAAKIGVFLHGLAADLALETQSQESLIAGDIVEYLGKVFKFVEI